MPPDGERAFFNLVRLTAADLGEVLELEERAYARPWTVENFKGEFARRVTLALGLKTAPAGAGRPALAAYCFFWLISPEIHLLNLAVRPEYRRRGLARRLLKAMLDLGRHAGAATVFLEVRPTNAEALALYHSFGFRVTGRRPKYYDDGEDAHLMTLEAL
ncbi:MAG: ribosomal protein S18-alanine N-acetyltransferase [Candidatus Adiutrix sp.]|jgi:ribosomal-protein-alanine N-acetyltransferase|nr:ribosomal protein S18-alanine N-acetyltransferase [Candidatus Adiutrix sp.]